MKVIKDYSLVFNLNIAENFNGIYNDPTSKDKDI